MKIRFFAVLLASCICLTVRPALAANAIQLENAKQGDPFDISPEADGEIEGYASATSINRGESINLFVNTTESSYTIEVFRMGWYGGDGARRMLGPVVRTGVRQIIPAPDSLGRIECNWTSPFTIAVPNTPDPTDWASGIYIARLTAGTSGKQKGIVFVVRDDARISNHYFQSSIATSQAYNNWGGRSLYAFNSTNNQAARKVSYNRPYTSGAGTGDFLFGWEYNMIRFLEREGFDVTYCTSIDTARRGALLLNHKDFLSVGHDEYWSFEARTNVESARDHGINLGFFSGNAIFWQIRLEPSSTGVADRTQVAYKEVASTQDPFALDKDPTNDNRITGSWRSPPLNRPESALIGVMYQYDPVKNGDIVLDNVSTPWIFAGTGYKTGDHLVGLLGYEVDAISTGSPAGITRIGHSPYTDIDVVPPATQFSDMTLYVAPSGANVFATGSIQFAWGLDSYNSSSSGVTAQPGVQQMTRNILYHFAGSSVAADCQYVVAPTSLSFGAGAGSGTVNVQTGCSWTATTSAPWITLIAPASGSGSGSASYTVAQNSGGPRSGTITVGDAIYTVTQAACSFSISPSGQSLPSSGGTGTFDVTADGGCTWGTSTTAPWLTITSSSTGSGNGIVGFAAAANTGPARSGIITVAGQSFTVSEADGCSYSLSRSTDSFAKSGGASSASVTPSAAACSWTAVSDAPWLTVTSGASGSGNGTIAYSAAPSSDPARSATLSVADQKVTITQASGCAYTATPSTIGVAAAGATTSVAIGTSATCFWASSSHAPWITITAGSEGQGPGTSQFRIDPNTGPARSATVTVAGNDIPVSQAGSCTYALVPTGAAFAPSATTATLTVTTDSACSWTATLSVPWLTITSAAGGTGSSTITYAVAQNAGPSRSGTITVGGQTFSVTQGSGCTYAYSSPSVVAPAAGTSGSIGFSASAAGCPWTATSSDSWLTLTTPASGSGSATFGFSVASNAGPARQATLNAGGQFFTVSQPDGCTYAASPVSLAVVAAGATSTIAITAGSTCPWSATATATWIAVITGATAQGNGSVQIRVDPNNAGARSGEVHIGTAVVTVSQAGVPCNYVISPTATSVSATNASGSFALTTSSFCNWTATASAGWITITSLATGSGNATIAYSIAQNGGPARTATIAVGDKTFTVSQAACAYSLSSSGQAFTAAGGTGNVTATADGGCGWTAVSNAPWITITSGSSGTGSGVVGFSVDAMSGPSRSGTITIAGQTFTITEGSGCTFTLSSGSATYAFNGGSGTIALSASSANCPWSAVPSDPWITVTGAKSGTGSATISYAVAANPNPGRSGTIAVGGQTFGISQSNGCSYSVSPDSLDIPAAGGDSSLAITTSSLCFWASSSGDSWITVVSGDQGRGPGTTVLHFSVNTGAARQGFAIVAGNTVIVSQAAVASCDYALSATGQAFPATGGSGSFTVTTSGSCAWTASSDSPWVTLAVPSTGSGTGTVSFTVAENSGVARSGSIQVGGQTFTVTEAAGGCGGQPCGTFGAPTSLNAAATPGGSVSASWTAVAGAAHYDVFRSSAGQAYAFLASSTTTTFVDGTAAVGSAYLYVVRAVDAQGNFSAFSQPDLATDIDFTDPILSGVTIKRGHMEELRTAVNAVRRLAGLAPKTFTDPSLSGVPIKAIHVDELRSSLAEARAALGLGAPSFANALTPGITPIRAVDLGELRNSVR
jgi:hypothetical protein